MKTRFLAIIGIILFSVSVIPKGSGQSSFKLKNYLAFVEQNKALEADDLISRHAPQNEYYSMVNNSTQLGQYLYLDTIVDKYELTQDELMMLFENRFVVTERLSFGKMAVGVDDVFIKDLPVFVSTDAILHALHISYSNIIKDTEKQILFPLLYEILERLYFFLPALTGEYQDEVSMKKSLEDIDLFITVAINLLSDEYWETQYTEPQKFSEVYEAIDNEDFVVMKLFTDMERRIDFSQFAVRGHYLGDEQLEKYFSCMMWLGRMEFVLANAPREWYEDGFDEEGLRRMNMASLLLNELVDQANVQDLLNQVDDILKAFIGESDNVMPEDLRALTSSLGIENASDLLDDTVFEEFQTQVKDTLQSAQLILSNILLGTPGSELTEMPIPFRLLGQRFIIDSYFFSQLVYDNIVHQGNKVCRMMPDPLDVMFLLGNDNALPLLREELETWHYAPQMANLRYISESYDEDFWKSSYYNIWLSAIRALNPDHTDANVPLFMKTVGWQQQKLNSQLASWTQLRHDNLLYTKQSYTHFGQCSFPHSYVEPYPELYERIADFAYAAEDLFMQHEVRSSSTYEKVDEYFAHLSSTMEILADLSRKELAGIEFDENEIDFLKKMISHSAGSSGGLSGWYIKLLFGTDGDESDWSYTSDSEFLIADVHTQPSDCVGGLVGKVLHVGTGNVNMGIFLAESPSAGYQPMAFVGPVLSYYETITNNFERLNDQTWSDMVSLNNIPQRPDWVNIYLADSLGNRRAPGRELTGGLYTGVDQQYLVKSEELDLQVYPNPVSGEMVVRCQLPDVSHIQIGVYNLTGQLVVSIYSGEKPAGETEIGWNAKNLPGGVYFIRLSGDPGNAYCKIVKQ